MIFYQGLNRRCRAIFLVSGNQKLTMNEFLNDIKPLTLKNSQMTLHMEDAINCLKLVGVKEIEME